LLLPSLNRREVIGERYLDIGQDNFDIPLMLVLIGN
jgi:hypothetical protein